MITDDNAVRMLCEHTLFGKWATLFAAFMMDMQPRHSTRSADPTHKSSRFEDAGEREHHVKKLGATDAARKGQPCESSLVLGFRKRLQGP